MSKQQTLTPNFIVELFKSCLTNQSIFEIVSKHLEFQYLPLESYKKYWKYKNDYFTINQSLPTVGMINEKFKKDQEVLDLLVSIKRINIVDKKDEVIKSFESFIKEVKFVELFGELGVLYNQDKQDDAIKKLAIEGEKIYNFSLRKETYQKVFYNFKKRQEEREKKSRNNIIEKVPFGIHSIDYDTRGGGDKGRSALFLGRSGAFKSTYLRWAGINAARLGMRVIHFQIEGTEQECLEAYDAGWTGIDLEEIEFGNIPKKSINKIKETNEEIVQKGGEIIVIAPEAFESLSINECDERIEEIEKNCGPIDLAIFDNLELFTVDNGFYNTNNGERKRREDIANKITNIAIKHKLLSIASTQANDIKPEKWNNPDFVLTRSDISEYKGLINPFSYLFTLNQTSDEYEAGIIRIFEDKIRKYKSNNIRKICQSQKNSRFYDAKRTNEMFWDTNTNKPR